MQTQVDFSAILVFLLFAGVGVFLIVSPVNLLHQLDKRTGKKIQENAPNPEVGRNQSRLFYRMFGSAFILIGALSLITNWPVIYSGNRSHPSSEIFVRWIRVATVVKEGDRRTAPARSIPTFPFDTKQAYVYIYTASTSRDSIKYRWFVNQNLQREFTVILENGDNRVPLNDNLSQSLPVGESEVYMSSDGVEVALVRFQVTK